MFDSSVMDKRSALPRHAQIEAYIRGLIERGRLSPGERIPPELEIAKALGVSRMTVNKALLTLTREGLFERERGLGTFVAERQAVAVRHLTVIMPLDQTVYTDEQDCYFGPLCRAMQSAAVECGFQVNLAYLPAGDYAQYHRDRPSEGVIVISPNQSRIADVTALAGERVPVVVVGARWEELSGIPSVDSDNIDGGAAATRYLIGLGHRRIAIVYAGPDSTNTSDRILGYRQALSEAGIASDPAWETEADWAESLGIGTDAMKALLLREEGRRPTAVFAAGYYLALETMKMARAMDLPPPDSLSVVGYDDPYSAQFSYPPLTTMRQPLIEMGRAAVEVLDRQLQNPMTDREIQPRLLSPQLQIRGSAARITSIAGDPL